MVVTSIGDTLTGMVDYQNWIQSPDSIQFYSTLNDKVVIYRPSDIKMFQVDGDTYVGAEVDIENSSRQLDWLSHESTLQLTRKSVFLRALVTGPRSLYHYKGSTTENLFYIKEGSIYTLLVYKLFYNDAKDVPTVRTLNKYIGQLLYYMSDRPEMQKYIQNVTYDIHSLTAVFNSYNKFDKATMSNQHKREKININYGLTAAATINSIHFTGADFPEFVIPKYSQGLTFTPGIFIEFVEPRNRGRWALYSELIYSTYKFEGNYDDGYDLIKSTMDFGYLKMYNLLRYRILLQNGCLFVNGGISIGGIIHEINEQERISKNNSDWNETGKALNEIYRMELGLVFGAGIKYKHITFESRYAIGGGMSPYPGLGAQTRSNSILVSYNF